MAEEIFFDSSAILAWIYSEPGGEQVAAALEQAEKNGGTLPGAQVSLAEISQSFLLTNRAQYAHLLDLVRNAPLRWVALTDDDAIAAGLLRADFKMSFADALIVTVARRLGAEFWHKDPEFDNLPAGFLKMRRLPYKPKKK